MKNINFWINLKLRIYIAKLRHPFFIRYNRFLLGDALRVNDPIWDERYFRWLYCLELTKNLNGDICELGVGPGRFTIYCGTYLKNHNSKKIYYGFDTFEGFPYIHEYDIEGLSEYRKKFTKIGHYSSFNLSYIQKLIKAARVENYIKLYKGDFKSTLPAIPQKQFSFAYMDCDLYESYKIGLQYVYPKVVPNGIILFDEYERITEWPGARRAIDEFFRDKPEKPVKLPFSTSYYVQKL